MTCFVKEPLPEELKAYAGAGPAVHMGRGASRSEHRGHFAVDLDAVEAVFPQASREADRQKHQKCKRRKERFHIASSSSHHNQDVKQRKSFFPVLSKNDLK